MVKICKKCGNEKILDDFSKCKSSKDGYFSYCKLCKKEIDSDYYSKNKVKVCSKVKEYRNSNKDILSVKKKSYSIENAEYISKWQKQYRLENHEKLKEYHKVKIRKYRKNNPALFAWRNILYNTLRRLGRSKEGNTIDIVGYSALDLKLHLESLFSEGMSCDNYGEWEIDHIKPVSKFSLDTDIKVVNALSNLQPLWWEDNIKKFNKI